LLVSVCGCAVSALPGSYGHVVGLLCFYSICRKVAAQRKTEGEAAQATDKKDIFIAALLSIEGFAYRGAVPRVMRYPRKPFRYPRPVRETCITAGKYGSGKMEPVHQAKVALTAA
jgi:hypothetical protein